jgi:hypothetical protein
MVRKTANEPHAKRRGWLKNSNPPGEPGHAPRCGARTRKGLPCGSPAVRGRKRCRMHGGRFRATDGCRTCLLETGPLEAWPFSAEAREEMSHFRELLRECKELAKLVESRSDYPPL